jgi:hypothetical protein
LPMDSTELIGPLHLGKMSRAITVTCLATRTNRIHLHHCTRIDTPLVRVHS